MTTKELITQIRAKNPQYSAIPDEVLLNVSLKQKPELKSQLTDYKEPSTSNAGSLNPESTPTQIQPETRHPLADFGIGALKGAGRSIVDASQMSKSILGLPAKLAGKAAGIEAPGFVQEGNQFNENLVGKINEGLEPSNKAQKIGGYAETAAEILIPSTWALKATQGARALSSARKALTMDAKELAKLSAGKFKKIFNIEKGELETAGGIIKEQYKKMPGKVKELAEEFKDVLQGNPTDNLNKAKELGKGYWKRTLDLFEGEDRLLNEKTIRAYLKNAIEENMSFDSPFQKKEILEKTIEPFMKQVKTGSLKGLEEARAKLSTISRDTSGKLKPAIDSLNKAIKTIIRENLPEEKKILYDAYKVKMAKLFDVREILKAKNLVLEKGSAVGNALKKTAIGGAIVGGVTGAAATLKKIFQ
jgi:hypothetical protein